MLALGLEEATDNTIRNELKYSNILHPQKHSRLAKKFSNEEIDFSSDKVKYISRPTETFLKRQKILNSRSLLSGTRSNGTAIFEMPVLKILVKLLEVVVFPRSLKICGIFCSIGDFISIRHSAQPCIACVAVVSVSFKPSGASTKDARGHLAKRSKKSRSGGEGRGRKGNACRWAQTFYRTPFVSEREAMMYYHWSIVCQSKIKIWPWPKRTLSSVLSFSSLLCFGND